MIRTLILSAKRAGYVTTHRRVANCTIVIPESEEEAYAKAHCRFAAGFNETYVRSGGLSEVRAPGADGIEPEVAATAMLRRNFGDAIKTSSYGSSVVTKRGKNPDRPSRKRA